jgi:hypothetical protein
MTTMLSSVVLHGRTVSSLIIPSTNCRQLDCSSILLQRPRQQRMTSLLSFSIRPTGKSSVDVDSDEDAEQRLGDREPSTTTLLVNTTVNGDYVKHLVSLNNGAFDRSSLDELLKSVGLDGKLQQLDILPPERKVSIFDIFCNRELKMSHIKAIGFDMDYTLAQYQQPAFDQLAFDGAKEKLVHKLGYPEQVLDFTYDHEVS